MKDRPNFNTFYRDCDQEGIISMTEDMDFSPDQLEAAGALGGSPDPGYSYPTDFQVAENLERWRDAKLGVIIHWGIYTCIGQAGSWSLHRSDLGEFTDPPSDFNGTDAEYHQWYYEQRHQFDASDFQATQWATLCANAGMKYVVFTAKHHDGFAMYDTRLSNLKVTAEDCPVGRDIFREVTDAFRSAGIETGVYFSKADWARPDYWDLARPVLNRFANYDTRLDPQCWSRFVQFSHDQIRELLTNYGPMNVLWLDAGWVRGPSEDFAMEELSQMARSLQPGILVVDREVHGPYEDYRTPEQEIPEHYLDYPWESCLTWTKSWCSTKPDEPCRPTSQIIGNLLRIVGRGGNYLVGFGPDATGALSSHLITGLKELGAWMDTHGEGIYGTRALANPPKIHQISGAPHEWLIVTKENQHYLYGVPESGKCTDVTLEIAIPFTKAQVLGGGQSHLSTTVEPQLSLSAPSDMGYVVRLT